MQSQYPMLAALPTELLANVASFLPTNDFNSLRLTCKPLEDKTFPYWTNCFFKKKQFMITPFSLRALLDISKHKSLSKVMTHLVIGLDDLSAVRHGDMSTIGQFSEWKSANCAQQALLQTGGAIDLLSAALLGLPNLKTIDLRNFSSPTRFRDATELQPCHWRSYGYSSHHWLHVSSRAKGSLSHDHIFQVVLAAIDRCSPNLESLEVILRGLDAKLNDEAFVISSVLGTGVTRTLKNLTKLHLDVNSSSSGQGYHLPAKTNSPLDVGDPATTYLRKFLALTTNVTWLRLNFPVRQRARFFSWLSLDPGCTIPPGGPGWDEMNPAPITLPLRRLDLGNVWLEVGVFHKVIAKFSNLEELSLRRAVLERKPDDSIRDLLDKNGGYDDGDCIWARVFRELRDSSPNLKRLTLASLEQKYKNYSKGIIFFLGDDLSKAGEITTSIDHAELGWLADRSWTMSQFEAFNSRFVGINNGHSDEEEEEDLGDDDSSTDDDGV